MNIWIFNHHALTPDMSGGTRHYDFAKELIKRGHSVTIVASSFHYSKYKEMKDYKDKDYLCEKIDGIDFIWIKTPPYFGNGINRVKNMISFTYKVLKYIPKLDLSKPDIIVGSSVHLFTVWAAYKLSCKYKTPFIMEVRDLWPQTLIDMGISKWHPFIVLLGWLEKYLYKKADKIISNLPYAYDYIGNFVAKEKFIWISNGVDLSNIKYIPKEKSDKFIISYTGAIGIANNLQLLLGVAKKLKEKKDIFFRIVGEGAEKQKLKAFVKENDLSNVSIENSVPKNEVSNILQNSDILYFNLKDSPVFNYGISSNKLFDYMASGRVIIFSTKAKNNPIEDANAGYSIVPDDVGILEKTILEIHKLSQEKRNEIGRKIRKYAEQNYSIEVLVDKFEKLLENEIRKKMIKSIFDRTLAFVLIILFSPFYIIVSLLILFKLGKPILFRQKRPGYKEKVFGIYKFRTMTNETDDNGILLPDEKRLIGVGKFIRSTSLDELPQLFNVLRGEMSFVGPRPLLIEYIDLYNNEQKRRHDVKPGITGWAQVNGRNAISWEQKFEYDVWYVDNQSFFLDIKILWLTFLKVVKRSDISSSSSATMEKFTGNN